MELLQKQLSMQAGLHRHKLLKVNIQMQCNLLRYENFLGINSSGVEFLLMDDEVRMRKHVQNQMLVILYTGTSYKGA